MKITFFAMCLLFVVSLPSSAAPKALPVDYAGLVRLYGPPSAGSPGMRPIGGDSSTFVGTTFSADGTAIVINGGADHGVRFIHFTRANAFGEMEIESLLKPLSPEEDWVQKDGLTWTLPKNGAVAVWNGEGRLDVTAK